MSIVDTMAEVLGASIEDHRSRPLQEISKRECASCGSPAALRCSRCHTVWFCSAGCSKTYWPFHRSACNKNDFADSTELSDPKFSAWLREHGRVAAIKDDEVERLEKVNKGELPGLTRPEVLEGMYNKMDPRPRAGQYSEEETRRMREREAAEAKEKRLLPSGPGDIEWLALKIDPELGSEVLPAAPTPRTKAASSPSSAVQLVPALSRLGLGPANRYGTGAAAYKWEQDLTHVRVFVRLPYKTGTGAQLQVEIGASDIVVRQAPPPARAGGGRGPAGLGIRGAGGAGTDSEVLLSGRLFRRVDRASSSWEAEGHVLEISLLKESRKGHYSRGDTSFNTYWTRLLDAPLALAEAAAAGPDQDSGEGALPDPDPSQSGGPPPGAVPKPLDQESESEPSAPASGGSEKSVALKAGPGTAPPAAPRDALSLVVEGPPPPDLLRALGAIAAPEGQDASRPPGKYYFLDEKVGK